MKAEIVYDDWQKEILDYDGDILLCKGRRIGGTEIFSIKAARLMIKKRGVKIVFVSLVEDQAKLSISIALEYLTRHNKGMIATGSKKPTLTQINLTNGSYLKVRPVGNTGNAVRGFDGDVLGVDEAPWQPAMMWKAARPIISTNDGLIWMWGTPADDEGYFYEQFDRAYNKKEPDARFKVWYKNSEEVLFNRPISKTWTIKQREGAKRILAEEKRDMTDEDYGNEYLGKFLSELHRFLDDDWIRMVCTEERNLDMKGNRWLGCDIGRFYDPSTFQDFGKEENIIIQVDSQITRKTVTTETQNKIIEMDRAVNYMKIGIDAGSGALGVGIWDNLMEVDSVKRKLEAMNNRSFALDREGKKKQYLKQMDYYNSFKSLGIAGKLKLLNDDGVIASLRSIRLTIPKGDKGVETKLKIIGNDLHIMEGMVRAVELAKVKSLGCWIY